MRERWRFCALDKLVPDRQTDRQTDRVTPWAPDGAKKETYFLDIHLTIFRGIRVVACRVAPVEVNIVPAALLPLPHPRLLCLGGEGVTLSEHKQDYNPNLANSDSLVQGLSDLYITNRGSVLAQKVNHGTQNCDIWRFGLFYSWNRKIIENGLITWQWNQTFDKWVVKIEKWEEKYLYMKNSDSTR